MKENRDGFWRIRQKSKEGEGFGMKFKRGNWKIARENENQLEKGFNIRFEMGGKTQKKFPKIGPFRFRTKRENEKF